MLGEDHTVIRLVSFECLAVGDRVDEIRLEMGLERWQAQRSAKRRLSRALDPNSSIWIYTITDDWDPKTGEVFFKVSSVEEEVVLTDEEIVAVVERDLRCRSATS